MVRSSLGDNDSVLVSPYLQFRLPALTLLQLAIARALIRDPEILLLDEATSQLDASTENAIRKAIAAASKGRTTIMIAHRLASVQHADRIFVFDDGRVVAQGKHDELVAMGGIYTNMVAAQELD